MTCTMSRETRGSLRTRCGKQLASTSGEPRDGYRRAKHITEPRSRIYLELAEDLAADAEPDVVVVGGAVFDLAGNTNDAKTVEAVDWIAPSLTVTVTGTANDRPIVNEDGSFSVDVRSDEDLNRRPTVYFVSIKATQTKGVDTPDSTVDDEYTYAIEAADEVSPLTQQEDENHWAKKYKRSSIDIDVPSDDSGILIGIVLLGEDGEDNSGATAGWTPGEHRDAAAPAATNKLNLVKLGGADLLLEIDEEFNDDVEDGHRRGDAAERRRRQGDRELEPVRQAQLRQAKTASTPWTDSRALTPTTRSP